MITQKQARTIVESVVEEMAERGWGPKILSMRDASVEAGDIVEVMLTPITQLTKVKRSLKR